MQNIIARIKFPNFCVWLSHLIFKVPVLFWDGLYFPVQLRKERGTELPYNAFLYKSLRGQNEE